MDIRRIKDPASLEQAYSVLSELREGLSFEAFLFLYENAHTQNGYTLVGVYEENHCVAIMGYRILFDFVHGKHLYVDDLVVTEEKRSHGLGAKLLHYAEDLAREAQCKGLRLCTGMANEGGRRFYERNGWEARAVAFKKQI